MKVNKRIIKHSNTIMIKNHKTRKTIAMFFVLNFLSTIIPYNAIYANNNGPNAPEAASFEPVDATDLVNLLTGDFTYTLPLLNVPSPEGGYPLSLSYHAGIAMDQEASWVGLGWNLNPGAINRNINGAPDDWGKSSVTDFFYDKGWEKNLYSFEIGGILPNGITLGLGASWGSDRAFGGIVSLGYGGVRLKYADGKIHHSASISVGGVGINYSDYAFSVGADIGNGVSLSYSERGGFNVSKGISIGPLDVSFSSQNGIGVSTKMFSTNTSTTNLNKNDHFIKETDESHGIDLGFFWAKYHHKKIEYALFKHDSITTSGAIYPSKAIKQSGNLQEENIKMDVYSLMMPSIEYDQSNNYYWYDDFYPNINSNVGYGTYDGVLYSGTADKMYTNRFTMFSKDNYTVASQGISGTFSPYIFKELDIFDVSEDLVIPSSYYDNVDRKYKTEYVTPSSMNHNKTFFYFDQEYASFLRINRGELYSTNNEVLDTPSKVLNYRTKAPETNYNESYSPNGEVLRFNGKKRSGNSIITYTNKEIRNGGLLNFIDAREGYSKLNRGNKDVYMDDGIGAFKITALDGKEYHYSLPVYNLEEVYKNFKEGSNEKEAFYEKIKKTPYATHWLLTAVTGPDYIDKNNNGRVDEEDYGYWVEFDYGKWAEGYGWRTPYKGYNALRGKESYSYGRKQLYYLDAIKTRTHTALFVKGLREDDLGSQIFKGKKKYTSGFFNILDFSDDYLAREWKDDPITGYLYDKDNNKNLRTNIRPTKSRFIEYVDIPKTYSLKLSEIVILKNKDLHTIPKTNSSSFITNQIAGKLHFNSGYLYSYRGIAHVDLFKGTNSLKNFRNHLAHDILDENDITSDLKSKSVKSVKFHYNYELAKNTSSSEANNKGRLTLKQVEVRGKSLSSVIPNYKFSYLNTGNYNKDMIDNWGYYEGFPQQWSLNEITSPTGGKIKINYEEDSFYTEGAKKLNYVSRGNEFSFYPQSTYSTTTYNNRKILNVHREERDLLKVTFSNENTNSERYYLKDNFTLGGEHRILSYSGGSVATENQSVLEKIEENVMWFRLYEKANSNGNALYGDLRDSRFDSCTTFDTSACALSIKVYGKLYSNNQLATFFNPNGKKGGGIRVKSVQVLSNNAVVDETNYSYVDNKGFTSGITTYEPSNEEDVTSRIPFITEIPSPRVYYNQVTVCKGVNGEVLDKTKYKFETFTNMKGFERGQSKTLYSLGDLVKVKWNSGQNLFYTRFHLDNLKANASYLSNFTIENRTSNLGRLLSKEYYNKEDQLIEKVKNNYKSNLDSDGEIGVTQETFRTSRKSIRDVNNDNLDFTHYYVGLSSKVNYPSVVESIENTSGGFTSIKYFDKHDFLSGQVLEERVYNSEGNAFKTEVVPAYSKYADMGIKIDNSSNKNMLTQSAGETTYVLKDNQWEVISSNVTTWKNNWIYPFDNGGFESSNDVWRKHKTYAWNGEVTEEGVYINFEPFKYNSSTGNDKWRKTVEVTKYNQFSYPLETKDINQNFVSTKLGDNYSKIIATANAAHEDMYYSGAEYLEGSHQYLSGNVLTATSSGRKENAHTGKYSL